MSSGHQTDKPADAFKAVMAAAQAQEGRAALAHQSLGRPVSAREAALAAAMMEIYAGGVTDLARVARQLAERGVTAPVSGRTDWDADLLETELRQANESFDAAYRDHGFGA